MPELSSYPIDHKWFVSNTTTTISKCLQEECIVGYLNTIQWKQNTRFSKTFICHVWLQSYLQFCSSEKFRHWTDANMTADNCDAAGYENPKPRFVEKGNVYPQPMRRRQLWGLRSIGLLIERWMRKLLQLKWTIFQQEKNLQEKCVSI